MATGYAMIEEAQVELSPRQKAKVKKPGFFKRWIQRQVKNAWDQEREEMNNVKMASAGLSIGPSTRSIDSDKGIRFQVYKASGGFVVETAIYDRQRDRHHNSLHIITDNQDLGQAIGKIITLEALKQ